ncbi:MAG: transglycosylase domain-containing protein [Alphaproteobacteria bacterium]
MGLYARLAESVLWLVLVAGIGLAALASGLPDTRALFAPPESASVAVQDVSGTLISHRGMTFGGDVRLEDLPDHVPQAILAIEDHRFFHHVGLDLAGLIRALTANLAAGRVVQGGSTLTQQLAKNLFLTSERTVRRKLQEALLALWLEARLGKDEILALYLNRVYYGAGTHGIDAAARRYFAKPARDLSLGEAAVLAGLLKAPSRYAPTHNADGAQARARLVLKRMAELGYITEEDADQAAARPLVLGEAATPGVHYFMDWIVDLLAEYVGRVREPLVVRTTLDLELQKAAESAVASVLDDALAEDAKIGQVALVALDSTGAVRALVGGRSYRKSPYNRVVRAWRQPGSAFKPFVYLAALEAGWQSDYAIEDRPIRVGRWSPSNFTGRFEGKVSLTRALSRSLNAATVRLTETIGRKRVIDTAQRMGLDADLKPYPSLPLGTFEVTPLSLTAAYVPMANGGRAVAVNPMVRIQTRSGQTLYERERGDLGQAAPRRDIDGLRDMMRVVVSDGTGRAAALEGYDVAGKTGTSQNFRDAWFIGHVEGLVAGVWVGNDDGRPMNKITGGTVPARIWKAFAQAALARLPETRRLDPPVPDLMLTLLGPDGAPLTDEPTASIAPANGAYRAP